MKDLTGQKFGRLTVLKFSHRIETRYYWLCECSCKNKTKKIIIANNLLQKTTISCGCYCRENNKNRQYKGTKDISGDYFSSLRRGAIRRNLEFNITIEQIQDLLEKQNYKCYLSGLEIYGSRNPFCKKLSTYKEQTISLDRINSSKGYVINNIQWLFKDVNLIKWKLDENYFLEICKNIYNFQFHNIIVNQSPNLDYQKVKSGSSYLGTKDISGGYFNHIRFVANIKNLPFNLKIDEVQLLLEKQNYRCKLSSMPICGSKSIYKSSSTYYNMTASLDRINPKNGYTINNVQWVHKNINMIKSDFDQDYFIFLCSEITKHTKNKN